MTTSILNDTKESLGILADDNAFDSDVIMLINMAFSTLNQLGVGPEQGFAIGDANATWDAFLGSDARLNNVKTYVFLRAKLIFDPPTNGYMVTAVKEEIQELGWRINMRREERDWTDPSPCPLRTTILDGGMA